MPDILDVIMQEKEFLRDELRHLKDCQLRYVVLAVGGTGAFFALVATNLGSGELTDGSFLELAIFLTPAVFVVPSMIIFFDKARSISRIVGYMRVMEHMVRSRTFVDRYMGWETALARWRRRKWSGLPDRTRARGTARYWNIIFRTFTVMLGVLWLAQLAHDLARWKDLNMLQKILALSILSVSFILIGVIVHLVWRDVIRLSEGEKSYDVNEQRWWSIHLAGLASRSPPNRWGI